MHICINNFNVIVSRQSVSFEVTKAVQKDQDILYCKLLLRTLHTYVSLQLSIAVSSM